MAYEYLTAILFLLAALFYFIAYIVYAFDIKNQQGKFTNSSLLFIFGAFLFVLYAIFNLLSVTQSNSNQNNTKVTAARPRAGMVYLPTQTYYTTTSVI